MPEMTGVEFLKKTMKIVPFSIRIVLTGYTDVNEIIESVNKAAIYKFITKPIEPEIFLMNIKRAIEVYELESQNLKLITELTELNANLEQKVKERTIQLEKSKSLLEKYSQEIEQEKEKFETLSITDDLTQLYNRRFIMNQLDLEIKKIER